MTTLAELRARYRAAHPPLSEDDFQDKVMDLAKRCGWMVCHYLPAIRQSGRISTAIKGDRGAPDLILARRGVVLLVELKTNKGVVSSDQRRWLDALDGYGDVWRPRDWDRIVEVLR
jgi:hypothetical protein